MKKGAGGWAVADEIGPAQLPVYLLPTRTGGWADLGVTIYGGGASAALMRLPHGKDGYPDNPTVAPATKADKAGLTSRQREVLELMARGLTNAEIAERLYLTKKTVEHHVSAILQKVGVDSRAKAVAAVKDGGNPKAI